MGSFSSIKNNLLTLSGITIALVLWLGVSFLVGAFIQRQDAMRTQLSTHSEYALNLSANALADERAILYRLLSKEMSSKEQLQSLHVAIDQSNAEFKKIRELLNTTLNDKVLTPHYTFDIKYLKKQLVSIIDQLRQLNVLREENLKTLAQPTHRHNRAIAMIAFDAYSQLIYTINELRKGIHFVPKRNNIDLSYSQALTNATWQLIESSRQKYSLIEVFILSGKPATISLKTRITELNSSISQAWNTFNKYALQNHSQDELSYYTTSLNEWYNNEYKNVSHSLDFSARFGSSLKFSLSQWRDVSQQLLERANVLSEKVVEFTQNRAQTQRQQATRNLIIDSIVLCLCAGMAFVTFHILKKVQHQANHDELTHLPNRRYLAQKLNETIDNKNVVSNESIALMMIDLSGFKAINDTRGHASGDELLLAVAERVSDIIPTNNLLARTGGNEFTLLAPKCDELTASSLAKQIQKQINEPFVLSDSSLRIGCRIGISLFPNDAESLDELQKSVDFALYSAKNKGNNCITRFDRNIATQFKARMTLETDLNKAIQLKQFELHYQPQFNLRSNRVDAVEALIRWNHPTRGMVPPFEFIPAAEELGLLPVIGAWVLGEACRQAILWQRDHELQLKIAVNVSLQQFMQEDFVETVIKSLKIHDTDAHLLELELTESVAMADINLVVDSLHRLRELGIKIALDDFGTGYSSLSYLQELPLDTLKIDRAFIKKLDGSSSKQQSMAATIAHLAQSFELETVAEGVEEQAQLNCVIDLGIDIVQGYYYSKPEPAILIPEVVKRINDTANQTQLSTVAIGRTNPL